MTQILFNVFFFCCCGISSSSSSSSSFIFCCACTYIHSISVHPSECRSYLFILFNMTLYSSTLSFRFPVQSAFLDSTLNSCFCVCHRKYILLIFFFFGTKWAFFIRFIAINVIYPGNLMFYSKFKWNGQCSFCVILYFIVECKFPAKANKISQILSIVYCLCHAFRSRHLCLPVKLSFHGATCVSPYVGAVYCDPFTVFISSFFLSFSRFVIIQTFILVIFGVYLLLCTDIVNTKIGLCIQHSTCCKNKTNY